MRKALLILIFIGSAGFLQAQIDEKLAPVKIQSSTLRYLPSENRSILEGNVVATSDRYTLTAERVTVYTNKSNEIERILCERNVNFKSADIVAVADNAELNQITKLITLTGGVKIYKGENYLEGDKVGIQYVTQEIDVSGGDRVMIIFNPESLDNVTGGQP